MGLLRDCHFESDCDQYHDLVRDFKDGKPEIVTLCGSTRFKKEINEANARLTLQGKIVISLGLFGHADFPNLDWSTTGTDTKRGLDWLHKRKIDLADSIYVVDVGGYIGESTRSEIEYAKDHEKPIDYLSRDSGIPFSKPFPQQRTPADLLDIQVPDGYFQQH
jgi:hypothetical protein